MRFDLSHLALFAAIGVLVWLLFTDGCCPQVEQTAGDTTSGLVQIDTPKPDTVYVPGIREIIRTVFRHDTAAVNRLLAAHDSAIAVLAQGFDARAAALVDSIRLHICDSLALVGSYLETAGDSNVTVTAFIRALGVVESIALGWQHHRAPVPIPGPSRALLIGFTASQDTAFGPSIQYHDRRGRSFQAGYDLIGKGITLGVHWTVWGR